MMAMRFVSARASRLLAASLSLLTALSSTLHAEEERTDLVYRLPTENDALFRGDMEGFYMYCDRTFEDVHSQPWEAGSYGMVRNPFRASDQKVMFSRFHEGIDIKPMRRDAAGEPLDEVRPIAPGRVVYACARPGLSNYGRYVVVAHEVPEGTIYSLYAHLARVDAKEGQVVGTGNVLGLLGHSGAGINRVRSHCHLEVCMLINENYDRFAPKSNKHGIYNGLNLVGVNAADLLMACRNGEPFSFSRYVSSLPEHYRVRVPCKGPIDLLVRYPFLYKGSWNPCPPSIDLAFTAEGVPIGAWPAQEKVSRPKVISCKPMPTWQQNCTVNRVRNSSKNPALTVSGLRYLNTDLHSPADVPPPSGDVEEADTEPNEEG